MGLRFDASRPTIYSAPPAPGLDTPSHVAYWLPAGRMRLGGHATSVAPLTLWNSSVLVTIAQRLLVADGLMCSTTGRADNAP